MPLAIVAIVAMLFGLLVFSPGRDTSVGARRAPAEVIIPIYPPLDDVGAQITYEVWHAIQNPPPKVMEGFPPPLPDRNPLRNR